MTLKWNVRIGFLSCAASALAVAVFTLPCLGQHYKYPFLDPKLPAEKRIDNILSLMTVDEKIDCLGVQTAVPRLGIPSYGGSEGIHGVVQRGGGKLHLQPIPTTQFPQPPGMGETWDPDLIPTGGRGRRARGALYHADTEV